jgi:hypothetical protein
MRFKNLLGLLAIGGAVAYAQKKRNGDLSLAGFKNTFKELSNKVKGKIDSARSTASSPIASTSRTDMADDSYSSSSSGFSRDIGDGSRFDGSTRNR